MDSGRVVKKERAISIMIKEAELATIDQKKEIFRSNVLQLQEFMATFPNALIGDSPEYLAVCPIKHEFADDMYIREIFLPKGMLFVTKLHKQKHPYFLLKGDCSVMTEAGTIRLKAPMHGITLPGTKRVIYTHEDTVWITVHATKETDITKIEDEVISKSYEELGMSIDSEITQPKSLEFLNEVIQEDVENGASA